MVRLMRNPVNKPVDMFNQFQFHYGSIDAMAAAGVKPKNKDFNSTMVRLMQT